MLLRCISSMNSCQVEAGTERIPPPRSLDPDGIIDLLHQRGVRVVPWEGWEAIEALEMAAGRRRGAKQVKVAERELLLAAASQSIATEPEVSR